MGLTQLLFVVSLCLLIKQNVATDNRTFPDDVLFGVATASYQVEGAWNEDGKGESIWDHALHQSGGPNGDVACDSYHNWKTDVEMLKYLGVNHYRFSISWPRILPNGFTNNVNEAGVNYYRNLISTLKSNGIEPFITLYHWDLPWYLQQLGGWQSERSVEWFADYARLVFNLYKDNVTYWVTFNEPAGFCGDGGTGGIFGYEVSGVGDYICTHNILKAHARAYHIYHDELKENGKVSIVLNVGFAIPLNDSAENLQASDRAMEFNLGRFAHPIFLGNYPQLLIDRIGNRSKLEGFSRSRLPEFSSEEIAYINGTADFFAINSYGPSIVEASPDLDVIGETSYDNDIGVLYSANESWTPSAASSWLGVYPPGMRYLLKHIKDKYNNPDIVITENGFDDSTGQLDDPDRITYIREYLSAILEAIWDDGVKLLGYTVWSLMDNFEWGTYDLKFGLYSVNFSDPNRTRTIKASGEYYKTVIATHCLVDKCL